jgi:hypothetical protein
VVTIFFKDCNHSNRRMSTVEESILSVEFIYCVCGCKKTKPKYTLKGKLASQYISTHYMRGRRPINYKGGYIDKQGYRRIFKPKHRLADSKGYIHEHRYLFEQYYNCCLLKWSHIHHINGIKTDNRIENLEGMINAKHIVLSNTQDKSKWYCLYCGSTITYKNIKTGKDYWYKYKNGHLCNRCYSKNK